MSVRAYRVNKIDCEPYDSLVDVSVEALEEAIKLKLDEELAKALKQDIEACRESGYVTYYCY